MDRITCRLWLGPSFGYSRPCHGRPFYDFSVHLRPLIHIRVELDRGPSLAPSIPRSPRKSFPLFTMKRILHHGYTVTGTAKKYRGRWRPHARVSWARGRGKIELQNDKSFTTKSRAEDYALLLGKHWVVNRIQAMQLLT
jgi:hypothetical protein